MTTFRVEDAATPAWSVTPVNDDLVYEEGPFIGCRGHHANRTPAPAFWFGHGLGFSTWEYGAPRMNGGDPNPTVYVDVTNTGTRPSREVVQVYLRPADPDQPVRLVGWLPVNALPGETVTAEVHTDPRMWRSWDAATATWRPLAPGGELLVAWGLGDVRGKVLLNLG